MCVLYAVLYGTNEADELFSGAFETREEAEEELLSLKDEYGNIPVRIIEVAESHWV